MILTNLKMQSVNEDDEEYTMILEERNEENIFMFLLGVTRKLTAMTKATSRTATIGSNTTR